MAEAGGRDPAVHDVAPSPRNPVLVVGSPRSGTSILVDALLAAGYGGYREGHFLSLIHPIAELVNRQIRQFAGDERVLISNIDGDEVKRRLAGVIGDVVAKASPDGMWFDKTGDAEMILGIPLMAKLWPRAAFLFAKRRGIENVVSRMRKFPAHNFEYHCAAWARSMSAWRKIRGELPRERYEEIEQQQLIRNPEAAAWLLCEFLGLGDGREQAIANVLRSNRPQQAEAGSAERVRSLEQTGWTDEQVRIFRKQCGPEMEAYGYSMDEGYTKARPAS